MLNSSINARTSLQNKGRIRLTTDFVITGNVDIDIQTIPKIIVGVWQNHIKNKNDSQILYDYYFNDTYIKNKTKEQRPDINNQLSIPRAFEIQRKINMYANGMPREYTALSSEKEKQIEIFNHYQLNECKHTKTQLANLYASITGVGYYCVLPDYKEDSAYEIYDENFTPFNTFMVYENTFQGKELMGVNYHTISIPKENSDGETEELTEFTVFTKYDSFIFITKDILKSESYLLVNQQIFENNNIKEVLAKPNPFRMIPIIEVKYHPLRIGIYEIVLDLLDCVNMFLSGDMDARQQAVDYVLVLTDCEFKKELNEDGTERPVDVKDKRLIEISTNGGTNQAKVDILSNKFDYKTTIDFINLVNSLIEKIVGIPTRKNQDIGGNSSTGQGAKNENGMRDLDDNADIIQAQALLSERKFIELVLKIDEFSPEKKLEGLRPIDVKVTFPRNEQENVVTSSNAYSILRGAGMNDSDAIKCSSITTDILGTTKRNKQEAEEKRKAFDQQVKEDKPNDTILSQNVTEED